MDHASTLNTNRIEIELRDVDEEILRLLLEGRCTPRYLSGEIGVVQQYISQRLSRLVEHDVVTKVDRGLYELPDEYKREVRTDGE